MAKIDRGRRKVIAALAALPLGGWLLWGYLAPPLPRQRKTLRVAKQDIPERGALVYRERGVAVIREGDNIYALSLVCTHLGCTVTVTPRELICPCHGSRFDRTGKVLQGPADRPLARYEVEDAGENISVILNG